MSDNSGGQVALENRLTRLETTLNDMHHRLFGNGQKGVLAEHDERITENGKKIDRVITIGVVLVVVTQFLSGSGVVSLENLLKLLK